MKVMMISHTCQSITEGLPKVESIVRHEDISLCVLVPDRWRNYGRWHHAQHQKGKSYRYEICHVCCPWGGPAGWYLHWYPDMVRVFKEFQPDVLDIWEEPWGLVSVQAGRLQRLRPEVRIISESEQNINKTLPAPFEMFRRYTLKHADFVVGRSSEAVEVARVKGFAGPAEVAPNGTNPLLFCPLDRMLSRQKLKLSGFVIGYIGRIVEEKGLLDLLHALALCPSDVTLIIAGEGPLIPQFMQTAMLLNLDGRIRLMGQRNTYELPELYNAMDALVLPSRTTPSWKEQFGRVIIEANACQIPVIGSSSGAIPEVVGCGGIIVPERDPVALAQAICTLRSNPEYGRQLGRQGREQVMERYTWERVGDQFADIYRRCMG